MSIHLPKILGSNITRKTISICILLTKQAQLPIKSWKLFVFANVGIYEAVKWVLNKTRAFPNFFSVQGGRIYKLVTARKTLEGVTKIGTHAFGHFCSFPGDKCTSLAQMIIFAVWQTGLSISQV